MNIEQLDRLFSAVSRKHPVKTFIVMGSLTVLGLVNQRKIPDGMIVSVEVDAYPESDPGRAFEIADDFGLGSEFRQRPRCGVRGPCRSGFSSHARRVLRR